MNQYACAGQQGTKVRSDCYVKIERDSDKGITVQSKVFPMYGQAIYDLAKEMLDFFELKNVHLDIIDMGALPFVLAARMETAIRRLFPDIKKEYLMPKLYKQTPSTKDRLRRSRLYLPGNEPKFMVNACLHKPDGLILDLEDSVAPEEKDSARILVRNALRQVDFMSCEKMVRINQLPLGLEDLPFILDHGVDLILIPKCEHVSQVQEVSNAIKKHLPDREVFLMPIIESALGTLNSYDIAKAVPEVVALAIGLEDYTADIGTQRTLDGKESIWARSHLINSAKAANVQAIDTVFSDVADSDGLRASVKEAKSLGFEGKGCIHPRQIDIIHEAFAPEEKELEKAKRIVNAFKTAKEKGLSVVSLGSKMIDPPVVKRAVRVVDLAIELGILEKNWQE